MLSLRATLGTTLCPFFCLDLERPTGWPRGCPSPSDSRLSCLCIGQVDSFSLVPTKVPEAASGLSVSTDSPPSPKLPRPLSPPLPSTVRLPHCSFVTEPPRPFTLKAPRLKDCESDSRIGERYRAVSPHTRAGIGLKLNTGLHHPQVQQP